MNDFLFSYLDTIDERLLEHLDDDNELSHDAVRKLRFYASSLLDGTLAPDHLAEDWADWFHLAPAFVLAYGAAELEELGDATNLLDAQEGHVGIALTHADRLPDRVGGQVRYVTKRFGNQGVAESEWRPSFGL